MHAEVARIGEDGKHFFDLFGVGIDEDYRGWLTDGGRPLQGVDVRPFEVRRHLDEIQWHNFERHGSVDGAGASADLDGAIVGASGKTRSLEA